MVDSSAGKILSQARLAKRLTIDEVAHATKLRPDKIVALENDDYSRFGSIAYGKGFLQIYARFLGVDLTEHLRHMEVPETTVSISDYQYLNSPHPAPATTRRTERGADRRERRQRRAPSVLPLLIVLVLGAAGLYGAWVFFNLPRITGEAPARPGTSLLKSPAPVPAPAVAPEGPSPSKLSDRPLSPPRATPATSSADAAFLADANIVPARRPSDEPAAVNELILEPIKKTWVIIRKDTPDSAPIFEDYLYPGVRPLKLHGAKFFVEVRDQSAVQIRKNGHPIAYQAPGISIP